MAEYVRQMPSASQDLARRPGISQRYHVDFPLLILLLTLTLYGLVVLYSASGQSLAAVTRQAQYFVIAYLGMFAASQISLQRYQRWSPALYLFGMGLLAAVLLLLVRSLSNIWLIDMGTLWRLLYAPIQNKPTMW